MLVIVSSLTNGAVLGSWRFSSWLQRAKTIEIWSQPSRLASCKCKSHQHEVSGICTSPRCKISGRVVASYQKKTQAPQLILILESQSGYLVLWAKKFARFEFRPSTINLFSYISTLMTTIACLWSFGQGSIFILGLFCK